MLDCAPSTEIAGADTDGPPLCFAPARSSPLQTKKVTVIVFPDEDGGYTAVMPYFSCGLIAGGTCLTAQGWTMEEALDEARTLVEGYLDRNGNEGRYQLEHALLEGLEVRDLELEVSD